jgi:hypothetical protein
MEPEGSLPCSQEPYTGPCPEPDQSNPHHSILSRLHITVTLKRKFNIHNEDDLEAPSSAINK